MEPVNESTRGTGPFVPKHDRQRHGIELITGDHVGVAHAGRLDPDDGLVETRFFQGERFDLERPAVLADHRRLDLSGLHL